MSKKAIIEENGRRTEIDYGTLPMSQINRQICAYEKKYGSYPSYVKTFSCADATAFEVTDIMDWECLIEERTRRNAGPA